MRIVEISKPNRTMLTGDWHKGTGASHNEGIAKSMERGKKIPWIGMGDLGECIIPNDKRFSIDEHKSSLMDIRDDLAGVIKPAVRNCIGLLKGNHEDAPSRVVGSITKSLCTELGVRYLTADCFVRFDNVLGFFCHRGRVTRSRTGPEERIEANAKVSIRDTFRNIHADVCAMGHIHTCVVVPPVFASRLTAYSGRTRMVSVPVEKKWCLSSPSLYKVYDEKQADSNYAEQLLVRPTEMGWVELVFGSDGVEVVEQFDERGKLVAVHKPARY